MIGIKAIIFFIIVFWIWNKLKQKLLKLKKICVIVKLYEYDKD